ncbi:hypothetical protein AB1Y20_009827 [Prymnesium parvum]|uniref:ADP,ATP carrier protein n=1 Tax=Prymnesium parvum TaxID=97485 RepID=A0AB34K362_PRYPA
MMTVSSSFPSLQESEFSSALLSLLSGCVAGIAAAAVSNPADALLTQSQSTDKDSPASPIDALLQILREDPSALFSGLIPRCVFFGALIAGQFLLYDFFKQLFGVSTNDITMVLDVFADRLSFYEGEY